jgi:hypothetical protein
VWLGIDSCFRVPKPTGSSFMKTTNPTGSDEGDRANASTSPTRSPGAPSPYQVGHSDSSQAETVGFSSGTCDNGWTESLDWRLEGPVTGRTVVSCRCRIYSRHLRSRSWLVDHVGAPTGRRAGRPKPSSGVPHPSRALTCRSFLPCTLYGIPPYTVVELRLTSKPPVTGGATPGTLGGDVFPPSGVPNSGFGAGAAPNCSGHPGNLTDSRLRLIHFPTPMPAAARPTSSLLGRIFRWPRCSGNSSCVDRMSRPGATSSIRDTDPCNQTLLPRSVRLDLQDRGIVPSCPSSPSRSRGRGRCGGVRWRPNCLSTSLCFGCFTFSGCSGRSWERRGW